MSRLFGAARQASEYVRRRMSQAVRQADQQIERQASSDYVRSRQSLARRLGKFVFGRSDRDYPPSRGLPRTLPPISTPRSSTRRSPPEPPPVGTAAPTPPPVEPTGGRGSGGGSFPPRPPVGQPPPPGPPDDDDYGPELGPRDFKLLGRDASYDKQDWQVVMDQMRRTPGSSNVFGYYFEFESRTRGILYVTFLGRGPEGKREGPGSTYAYYDVPGRKFHEFKNEAAMSAGGAVWDYLRIRGTTWGHQHQYRLIQAHGDYVPRKATQRGYRTRHVPAIGDTGRREYRRSTLPERVFPRNDGGPDRGRPNRGQPPRD